jgi:hypothetical protein
MRQDRVSHILAPALALVALAAVLVLLGLAVAGPAHAGAKATETPTAKATRSPSGEPAIVLQRGAEVQFGEDVYVPAGTTTPSVVAFGGDITVDGTVTDAVVAFGGDVRIRGTVGTSTVVFGGDVIVGPDAVLGSDLKPTDASLVLFGGKLTLSPGAEVVGQTETFKGVDVGGALGLAAKGIFVGPGFSFIGWVVQTAFCLVLALVIAALMPGQLRTVQRSVGRKPWASLGWGALVFFVLAPAVLLVLIISIIGLLLVLPYVLFVLLAYFFAATGAAAFLAQKVITGFGGKENLMLAVTVGVVGTTVVSQIPVAGQLAMLVLMLFGLGASVMAVADWRRRRREAAAAQAAGQTAVGAQYAAAGGAAAQASVITSIVSTAPVVPMGSGQATAATVPEQPPAQATTVSPPTPPTAPAPPAGTEPPEGMAQPAEAGSTQPASRPGPGEEGDPPEREA